MKRNNRGRTIAPLKSSFFFLSCDVSSRRLPRNVDRSALDPVGGIFLAFRIQNVLIGVAKAKKFFDAKEDNIIACDRVRNNIVV